MKGFVFLVVTLAVSAECALHTKSNGKIWQSGEDKDITDANEELSGDDILMVKFQRSAVSNKDILWPTTVPYVLNKDLEMNAKGVILRAIEQFRLKSCIDFKLRDSEDYYLHIQKLGGCYSYVGRVIAQGQDVSIGTYCDEISTVEHELLHALGFLHEQSRYDRDEFVRIAFENVREGRENNFEKESNKTTTTQGVPYDYNSVMHYGKNAFTNGNGSTIITIDPKFQDVIGQRLQMSPKDVKELNLLYKCDSSVAFMMHCSFSEGKMCHMDSCSQSAMYWKMETSRKEGPKSDHTSLPSGKPSEKNPKSYFMHVRTAMGVEGESAWLETHEMSPKRDCHVQCLQFYYYNSGSPSDRLNIWIREFHHEWDYSGTLRLMGQITGPRTSHWQVQHVSLNATKRFQVVFEAHKGPGQSYGGFSIDDINLSETECPHVTLQFDNFLDILKNSSYGDTKYSDLQYSRGGYAYTVGIGMFRSYFGLFVQLLAGKYDNQLEWPVPNRQVTFQMLDQTPNIQMHMSKQRSIVSDRSKDKNGFFMWGFPVETGPLIGRDYFSDEEEVKSYHFLKGGSVVFTFSFQDITPLVNGSVLPCPHMKPVEAVHHPDHVDKGPCSKRFSTTTHHPTTPPLPKTTDNSIFGVSAGLVCSPVLTLLLALMLLLR